MRINKEKELHTITEDLATGGLGHEDYPLSYRESREGYIDGFRVVDVRMLYDGPGNKLADYRFNIARAVKLLRTGKKVAICCAMGISRSNAIALGVLMKYHKMEYGKACAIIAEKVPTAYIADEHLLALEQIFMIKAECRLGSWSKLPSVYNFLAPRTNAQRKDYHERQDELRNHKEDGKDNENSNTRHGGDATN
jgi:hypothetical protein